MSRRKAIIVSLAVTATAATGASGCTLFENTYEIPSELCGFSIAASDADPLLPDGEKLEQEERGSGLLRLMSCSVFVDDAEAIFFSVDDVGESWTVEELNEIHPITIENTKHINLGRGGLVGAKGAVTLIDCATDDFSRLFIHVHLGHEDPDVPRGDLETFLRSLTSSVQDKWKC